MKKIILAALPAFLLVIVGDRACAQDYGACSNGGCGSCGSCGGGCGGGRLAALIGKFRGCQSCGLSPFCMQPWYTYYPYDSYFQTPAPQGQYPYWPSPMTPTSTGVGGGATMMGGGYSMTGSETAGFGNPAAPAYWYGR